MPASLGLLERHGKPQFERHIEPRRGRRCRVEFDTREVVERITTALEQVHDPVEATLTSRNLERGPRNQCEAAESREERQKQLFVLGIVGDVEECGIRQAAPSPTRGPSADRHLREAHAQGREVCVCVPATRFEATPLPALARGGIRPARARRLCTIASIIPAICRARFCESPISRAVSSRDGTGDVIRTLRGMKSGYAGDGTCVNSGQTVLDRAFRRTDRAENSRRVHPTPESDDQRPEWQIRLGTVSSLIDAEDQFG